MIMMIMIIENRFSDLSMIGGGTFFMWQMLKKLQVLQLQICPIFNHFHVFGLAFQVKGQMGGKFVKGRWAIIADFALSLPNVPSGILITYNRIFVLISQVRSCKHNLYSIWANCGQVGESSRSYRVRSSGVKSRKTRVQA
jgi:hypothetical protein